MTVNESCFRRYDTVGSRPIQGPTSPHPPRRPLPSPLLVQAPLLPLEISFLRSNLRPPPPGRHPDQPSSYRSSPGPPQLSTTLCFLIRTSITISLPTTRTKYCIQLPWSLLENRQGKNEQSINHLIPSLYSWEHRAQSWARRRFSEIGWLND